MKDILKSKKKLLIAIVAVFLVFLFLVHLVVAIFINGALFKKDGWKAFEEYSYGKLLEGDSEWIEEMGSLIETENKDGKMLKAIEIKNENVSDSYIIIGHQYGGGPETMVEYAKHFYELGFNIILPYLRGHGESEYKHITLGWKDGEDIRVWVDDTISRHEESRIALFGVSMGANAVTLASTEELPENVRLVMADSCYTSLKDVVKGYIKNETPLTSFPAVNIISALSRSEIGESLKKADSVSRVGNIDIPILFINGEDDGVITDLQSKQFYENCNADGLEEVVIPDGAHGRNLKADEAEYWASIDGFILNNLGL